MENLSKNEKVKALIEELRKLNDVMVIIGIIETEKDVTVVNAVNGSFEVVSELLNTALEKEKELLNLFNMVADLEKHRKEQQQKEN